MVDSAAYVNLTHWEEHKIAYYDSDGNLIATFDSDRNLCPEARLDPNSSQIEPYSCELYYWSGIEIGFGYTKGPYPGWFIIFRNQHGKEITRYRYDREHKQIQDYSINSHYKGFARQFDLTKPLTESEMTSEFNLTKTKVIGDINPREPDPPQSWSSFLSDAKQAINFRLAHTNLDVTINLKSGISFHSAPKL
jgi:hypothetical protein